MTKKLKRKVKRIAVSLVTAAASICTVAILSADVFVMPMNSEEITTTKMSEASLSKTIEGISETSYDSKSMYSTKNAKVATMDIQAAANYTIALKEDGTVWGYGINTTGEIRGKRL